MSTCISLSISLNDVPQNNQTPTDSMGGSDRDLSYVKHTFTDFPYIKYTKRLLLRCIHHFKSDLIDNMDHMRISGTEPSSVILSQTK